MASTAPGPSLALPNDSKTPSSFIHGSQTLTFALTSNTGSNSNSLYPLPSSLEPASCLSRIKLSDILPEDTAPSLAYLRAIEDLFSCLNRHGAAIVELNAEDTALLRCALESVKLYFWTRAAQTSGSSAASSSSSQPCAKFAGYTSSGSREVYHYRAGCVSGEIEQPPACMSDAYRCLGKASRVLLGAVCRQLQLRSDVFCSLLDDCPLPRDEISSSVLLATHFGDAKSSMNGSHGLEGCSEEVEMGLITLIASDAPGLQVCDTNGLWYLADIGLRGGDLLLMTGRAFQHLTAGLCHACSYRIVPLSSSSSSSVEGSSRRVSLTFRLMPRGSAILDGSAVAEAGHVVPEVFTPVVASKFLQSLSSQLSAEGTGAEKSAERKRQVSSEPTLRSLLSDPLTGDLLEDAYTAAGCGHTFGGGTLKRVQEMQKCSSCGAAVNVESMIPNLVLRSVAIAFDREDRRRRLQLVSRKRRKELREHREKKKKLKESTSLRPRYDDAHPGGLQYPFNLNEKVLIKGNKRTPEKLVGREAVVASKCLNGWYLLRLVDNGESVRLQYRSLECMPGNENRNVEDSSPPKDSAPVEVQ